MATKSQSERREMRYPFHLVVTLRSGSEEVQLPTSDVSYRGIFLCTDTPPSLRELIAIEATLPPDNTHFRSHGMSVFTIPEGKEGTNAPGSGIQFYAQSDNDRAVWERFILFVRENITEEQLAAPSSARRKHPRLDVKFEVKPANIGELNSLYTRNLSTGGMFLETDMALDIGQHLQVSILHPVTQKGFSIGSIVRRKSHNPKGLGVEFTGLDVKAKDRFQEFIVEGIEALSEIEERANDDLILIEVEPNEIDHDFALEDTD